MGRDHARADAALAELRSVNPAAEPVFIPADLSLVAETEAMTERVRALTARLDAIVCRAGS